MSKKTKYKQCSMVRKRSDGSESKTVSWIPEIFAKVGGVVKLKNEKGEWQDGFEIITTSEVAIDEPPDFRKSIRSHKKRTGDSLPKNK